MLFEGLRLAPNTQYHVTVAADAKTAPGVKIGQAAVVAVNTTPLPSPSPTPNPSPSPPAPPQITGERSVPSTSGRVVGWTADGLGAEFHGCVGYGSGKATRM